MSISSKTRWRIFERDDFTCRYCGRRAPTVEIAVDHVFPRSQGGSDDDGNLVTACVQCNSSKSDRVLVNPKHREQSLRRAYVLGWISSALRTDGGAVRADEDFDLVLETHPLALHDAMWRTQVWLDLVRDYSNRENGYQHLVALLRSEKDDLEASA